MDRYSHIDENALDRIDRLGLAYCRLISWQWDEIVGPKPEGFDEMPESGDKHSRAPGTKHYCLYPAYKGIESIIGEANTSRCWWKFELGRTEQEWLRWYCSAENYFYDRGGGACCGDGGADPEPHPSLLRRLLRLLKL